MLITLERQLHNSLIERLSDIGFTAVETLVYSRMIATDCQQMAIVPTRRESNKLMFSCRLGIRFESIESILESSAAQKSNATAACPIHFLTEQRSYLEWEVVDSESLAIAVDSLVAMIIAVGLPFLDSVTELQAFKEEITDSAPAAHFSLSPFKQVSIVSAIYMLQGNRTEAEQLLLDALDDPRNQHPGRRRRLQEVWKRLFGA